MAGEFQRDQSSLFQIILTKCGRETFSPLPAGSSALHDREPESQHVAAPSLRAGIARDVPADGWILSPAPYQLRSESPLLRLLRSE